MCCVNRPRNLDKPRNQRSGRHLLCYVVNDGYTHKYLVRHLVAIGEINSLNKPNPVDTYLYGERLWGVDERGLDPVHSLNQYIEHPQRSVDMSHRFTHFLNMFWDTSRWSCIVMRNTPSPSNHSIEPAVRRRPAWA
jgi:hypothetical protein